MKKLSAAIAIGAALFAAVVAPTSASASPQTLLIGGRCADYGSVRVNTAAVYVRTGASLDYRIAATVTRGQYLSCWPIIVGGQYRLCSNGAPANGWIPVDVNLDGQRDGYVPSTCVTD